MPTRVFGALERWKVVQVAAGACHTVCLSTDGTMLVCGDGSRGQLGLGDRNKHADPVVVAGKTPFQDWG